MLRRNGPDPIYLDFSHKPAPTAEFAAEFLSAENPPENF